MLRIVMLLCSTIFFVMSMWYGAHEEYGRATWLLLTAWYVDWYWRGRATKPDA